MLKPGLLIAAPAGGVGVTTISLGLARLMRGAGQTVASFKAGGDARDNVLHEAVLYQPCLNLDSWAQRLETLVGHYEDTGSDAEIILGDGHGGLFDPDDGSASGDADLAALLGLPIVLVVDATAAGRSLAPMIAGLSRYREDIEIAAIFLNRVHSVEHAVALRRAFDDHMATPIVGYLVQHAAFEFDETDRLAARMLDVAALDEQFEAVSDALSRSVDLEWLIRLAKPPSIGKLGPQAMPLPVLGQRIAVAQDEGFAFAQQGVLTGWYRQGAQLLPFAPLADEVPSQSADAVYLPPGPFDDYPALLAGRRDFMKGLNAAAQRDAIIYGEGMGYAVLGEFYEDSAGGRHAMAGLLPLVSRERSASPHPNFLTGGRRAHLAQRHALGIAGSELRGIDSGELVEAVRTGDPLFRVATPDGTELGTTGCIAGKVSGSPLWLMDRHRHLSVVRD